MEKYIRSCHFGAQTLSWLPSHSRGQSLQQLTNSYAILSITIPFSSHCACLFHSPCPPRFSSDTPGSYHRACTLVGSSAWNTFPCLSASPTRPFFSRDSRTGEISPDYPVYICSSISHTACFPCSGLTVGSSKPEITLTTDLCL